MEFAIKITEILFKDLTPDQKFGIELSIILGIIVYLTVAMITKTTIKFLGFEMKSKKEKEDDV